jgi:hypothetical protein
MSQFVRLNTTGILDKDTDSQYLREGNYEDANDIRHRSLTGSENLAVVPVVGNALSLTIPNTGTSQRVYRVFININTLSVDGTLYYKNSSTSAISAANLSATLTTLSAYYSTLTSGVGIFQSIGLPASPAFSFSSLTTTSATTGYFDVSLNALTDDEYLLWQVGNLFEIHLLTEYINTSRAFKVIGSEELNGDVFVWSVTDPIYDTASRTIAELGVVTYNEGAGTYAYTRLLRSKLLNFSPDYRVQAVVERTNVDQTNLYWTDNLNRPRSITIKGPYATDMALRAYGGDYDLDLIETQSSFVIQNPSSYLTIQSVNEGAGSVSAGNKRYLGRFLTDDLVPSDYLYATNPVNIYSKSFSIASEIVGDIAGTLTDKSVTIQVNDIPAGIYSYFELVVAEYAGGGFSAKMVERFTIAPGETQITVNHTNRGQTNSPLANVELIAITSKFEKVQTMKVIANRMSLSNIKEQVDYDLSAWASAITHTLEYKAITSVGKTFKTTASSEVATDSYPDTNYGEYLNPMNTYNYTGYMMNDTYRFGIQVQWKSTGKWSQPFWIDDIKFDTTSTNVTSPNRRTANNITSNFTNSDNSETYVYYPKFGNINLNYSVPNTGKLLFELISSIRIVRAERIPEVLATGLIVPGVSSTAGTPGPIVPFSQSINASTVPSYANFPNNFAASTSKTALGLSYGQVSDADESTVAYFYSPDHFFGVTDYSYVTGDTLLALNRVNVNNFFQGFSEYFTSGGVQAPSACSNYEDTSGYYTSSNQAYVSFNTTQGRRFEYGGIDTSFIPGSEVRNGVVVTSPSNFTSHGVPCYVFQLTQALTTAGKIPAGLSTRGSGYYGQIFRNKGANLKYPRNKYETIYQSTGHIYNLFEGQNGVLVQSVFGGDVYVQKTHFVLRRTSNDSPLRGFGHIISFYSQNVGNIQMMNIVPHDESPTGTGHIFPTYVNKTYTYKAYYYNNFVSLTNALETSPGSIGSGLFNTLEEWPEVHGQRNYDTGYNAKDGTITDTGFDETSDYTGERPATIWWSQKKVINSTQDNYRIFKPIDYADLDLTLGEISTHEIVNGNLYTIQQRSVQRQYFSDAAVINANNGTDIVIGSGSILGAPGVELTSIGCDKKWSVVKGRTANGKDNLYWYNDQLRKMVRLGGDGISVISDRGLASFLQNKANWLRDKFQHISGEGVHGVWNDKYNELIYTFKAINTSIIEYPNGGTYTTGQLVKNTKATAPKQSNGLSYVYRAKSNFTVSSDDFEPGVGASWTTYWDQLSAATHPQYFTLFTLVFDELKNGFISFHSYYPNIYMPFLNTFYSTKPDAENQIWVHDKGDEMNYYGTGFNGNITSVMNYDLNLSKNFEAVQVVTGTTPYRLDFSTRDHVSFLTQGEFEELEDYYYAPIKNDSTLSGVNSGDSSRLWGRYLKIKFTFLAGGAQKLLNYIIKYRPNHRLYRK